MQASVAAPQAAPALVPELAAFIRFILQTCGRDFLQAVDDLQLSISQLKALERLGQAEEDASVKQLGEQLGLSLPAISRAVDGLVQRELVTRTEDTSDRRIKRVRITRAGRKLFDELSALRVSQLGEFVETLTPRNRAGLAAALRPIVAREEIAALIPKRRA